MNGIWLSYVIMFCVIVFWITNFAGYFMAKKLYNKLCTSALPSIFNLMQYLKIQKCLFALKKEDLNLNDKRQLTRLRVIIKVQNVSLAIIITTGIGLFIKQGFKPI